MAVKNESNYEVSYILYYVIFNLVDKTVLLKLFWHRNDRIRIFLLLFSSSVVSDSATPWTAIYQASLSFIISQSLFKFISIESTMLSNHLIWTARRSNQAILKEISPGISLEGMMLKLKLQYFGHLM